MPRRKDLNTKREKIIPVGISMEGEVYELFCPVCAHKMIDLIFEEKGIEFPEKQCPICLTIYQLASASEKGAENPQEIILAPRSREWLRKNGDKHIRGALPGSW